MIKLIYSLACSCFLFTGFAWAETLPNCPILQSGHGVYGHLSTAKINFPCVMKNSNYAVVVTFTSPGPKSNFYVSNKNESGFQVHSEMTGVGTQAFDWIVVQDYPYKSGL